MIEKIYSSPLGKLKITCENGFLSGLQFMEDGQMKESDQEVRNSELPFMQHCIEELNAYFKGELKKFTLPLKQQGTEFQQRVWEQLYTIDYAKTISYLELARKLGDPKCIRAAGTANGKNNIAIIVPCHRVIGSKQQLTGYAGGLWRKQWLLEHEAKYGAGKLSLF